MKYLIIFLSNRPNAADTRVLVLAGILYRRGDERSKQLRVSDKLFRHPEYSITGNTSKDIGLVQLHKPLILNDLVQVAKLPKFNSVHDGNVIVAGWGVTTMEFPKFSAKLPEILQVGEYFLLSHDECQKRLNELARERGTFIRLSPFNMCTGPVAGGHGICNVRIIFGLFLKTIGCKEGVKRWTRS